MSTLFLSYSRGDSGLVLGIHDGLERAGYTVFWDQENRAGDRWTEQVMEWLRRVDAVVLIVSPHSIGSYSVQCEIQIALADLEKPVIPVQLASSRELLDRPRVGLWLLIRLLQRVDAWPPRDALEELLAALRRQGFRPAAPPPPAALLDDGGDSPEDDEGAWVRAIPPRRPPPPPSASRARIEIELPGSLDEFDEGERAGFRRLLASLASIDPSLVRIVAVEAGSIRVTVELPESTARWLVESLRRGDEVARILSIRAIRNLTPLAGRGPVARLRAWLGDLSLPQRVAWGGALALLLLFNLAYLLLGGAGPRSELAICGDLSLTAGACPAGAPAALFQGELPDNTLGGPQADVPLLLAPRGGRLLSTEPLVRWTPAPGAAGYEVSLIREGAVLWSEVVTGATELAYPPAGAPPLERGATYRFSVRADDGRAEDVAGIGFTVLGEAEAEQIRAEEGRARAQAGDEAGAAVLAANLYAGERLYGEALGLLEPVAGTARQPAAELLRGNIYATVDLPELALASYERALALAAGDARAEEFIRGRIEAVREKIGG